MTDSHSSPGTTPAHDAAADATYAAPVAEPTTRDWRRLARSRKVLTAGAVVAGLAIGGVGFGAGYAVGDDASTTQTGTTQTDTGWGDRGPGGPMGEGDMGGQMGVPPGTTGEAPDFDGDGLPDTDPGTGSGTDSGSGTTTQQS